jgi:hypothetical protein
MKMLPFLRSHEPASLLFRPKSRTFVGAILERKLAWLLLAWLALGSLLQLVAASEPRIVNIYNFIRNSDFRLQNSEELMFDCTRRQIDLLKRFNLPATWALQYDALINPRYQILLKEQLGTNDEIAAWWEIPRPLAEKAGIQWRGQHDWDPAANVGFSPGYTPRERLALVDAYMADFKAAFGHYPHTVGSWFIDEVTLDYLAEKYGIVASCNCKDQIGTDFYTLWGGYWNQAYYPSRLNSYMPAQTRAGQINVPIFRMLGSDPIYQHGVTPGLISLEPVYAAGGGGMPQWVDWFLRNLTRQPSLAFGYTQAGQENSFTWSAMQKGLNYQIPLLASMAHAGDLRVQTLEQSGIWFRKHFPLTPATSVVALDDWKAQGHRTVWYDSRFYRLNLLWTKERFFIRDIHCFDEHLVSPTHQAPLENTSLTYETLPIVDWAFWSLGGKERAGMWPELEAPDGKLSPMQADGGPVVKEASHTELSIQQPLQGGGTFSILCAERGVTFKGFDARGRPLRWACHILGGAPLEAAVKQITATTMVYTHSGVDYQLKLGPVAGSCRRRADGSILLTPNDTGTLVMTFDTSTVAANAGRHAASASPHRRQDLNP